MTSASGDDTVQFARTSAEFTAGAAVRYGSYWPVFDDEDGVVFSGLASNSAAAKAQVTVNNTTGVGAYLRIWIDWNQDGDFDDANESVIDRSGVTTGTHNYTFSVPAVGNATVYTRTRISTKPINSPYGYLYTGADLDSGVNGWAIADGEVEDHAITVATTPVVSMNGVQTTEGTGGTHNVSLAVTRSSTTGVGTVSFEILSGSSADSTVLHAFDIRIDADLQ